MPFTVIITKTYDDMSVEAGKIVLKELKNFKPSRSKKFYNLGLATGNSPTGLYQYLADNQFKAENVVSFNLDEYIGLPGENAQLRALHPESYSYFMIQELFAKLNTKFAKTYVPYGTLIDQKALIKALASKKNKKDFVMKGTDKGKAVAIKASAKDPVLKDIKKNILDAYTKAIKAAGGIDLHIVGVGGRGHVAFHESGIPLSEKMLCVKLDDNTIENAVKDGHFAKKSDSPNYAISMGAGLVYQAKTVLLVANGPRKTDPVAESLLGPVTADVPISYGQKFAKAGGNMIYVLDKDAAKGIIGKEAELKAKGIKVVNKIK
jgi:glucosamine-6-phosphate deaminase